MVYPINSRKYQWLIDILFGVSFLTPLILFFAGLVPRTAVIFAIGVGLGYVFHVTQKMLVFEETIRQTTRDELQPQAEQAVQQEVEETVKPQVEQQTQQEVEQQVAETVEEEMQDEVEDAVEETLEEELEETVQQEVDKQVDSAD